MTAQAALPTFAVVVPMYNEEAGAARCVDAMVPALSGVAVPGSLIIVDDGSSDSTWQILQEKAAANDRIVTFRHAENKGYGAALATGTQIAFDRGADYVLFMDSDLTNAPTDIPRFYELMCRGYDVIKATRFAGGGGMQGVPFRRAVFSHAGNWLARVLFRNGLSDCTNGFRAVRTALLVHLDRTERGFASIVEELCNLKPLARTYAEVPVVLTSRTDDVRATSFTYDIKQIARYLKYALKASLEFKPR